MAVATDERIREIEALEQELVDKQEKLTELKRGLPPQEVQDYTLQSQKGPVNETRAESRPGARGGVNNQNWAFSVDPWSATVEDRPPAIVWIT